MEIRFGASGVQSFRLNDKRGRALIQTKLIRYKFDDAV